MQTVPGYLLKNKEAWNKRTTSHVNSAFYNNENFKKGESSLKEPELYLLGDLNNKKVLHLQCHFGQDTISLVRLGAIATGIDLSDEAIFQANKLADETKTNVTFICSDVYELPSILNDKFDIVFASYGTIGWLPDMDLWAKVIAHFLMPGGRFIFAEFHPFIWMYDDKFENIIHNYFNAGPIIETENGSYADPHASIVTETVGWNHSISEVVNSLLQNELTIDSFDEFNYSPFNCFKGTYEYEPGKFRIRSFNDMMPMVYALSATRK